MAQLIEITEKIKTYLEEKEQLDLAECYIVASMLKTDFYDDLQESLISDDSEEPDVLEDESEFELDDSDLPEDAVIVGKEPYNENREISKEREKELMDKVRKEFQNETPVPTVKAAKTLLKKPLIRKTIPVNHSKSIDEGDY